LLRGWIGWLKDIPATSSPLAEASANCASTYGPGYRVYFQKRGSTIVVLLCGGDKSTQAKDIRAAKHLAAEWSE
jgi:putative addiction module killer protein